MKLHIEVEKKMGDFSLQVNADISGERVGIFGQSGSGKSTLVHLVSGMLQPDSGEIFLDGDCLFSSTQGINLSPEKRRIALVFQHAMLFPHLSVNTNLLYGYNRCRPENKHIRPEALIDLLKLQPLLERRVRNLSGGEKQRVALGRAVLANPRLLVMDEPLAALDDALRFQVIPYLVSVGKEFSVPYLFISHSLTEMQLKQINKCFRCYASVFSTTSFIAIQKICFDAKVREKHRLLKNKSNAPFFRRKINALPATEEALAIKKNFTAIRLQHPCNKMDKC